MKRFIAILAFPLLAQAALADDLLKSAQDQFKPLPSKGVELKDNPNSKARFELGQMLYFEPRLSKSGLISCHSCHNLSTGGADLQTTSTGHGWQKGPRNAPTTLNSAYHIAQFWDGRAPDLEAQAKGPVQAGVEMASTPAQVEAVLNSMPDYQKHFKKAFPNDKQPVSFDNMAKAIALFEASLVTPDSKFDLYLKGKKALNKTETAGLKLFIDKGCASCHNGVNIGGGSYQKFGVVKAPIDQIRPVADTGRQKVTSKAEDAYVFRVPTLRNIELTGPYFHSGAVSDLGEAVKIMGEVQLGVELSKKEIKELVAFLETLTGKQPQVTVPALPPSTKETPKPDLSVAAPAAH
ncbi:MAG: cytochrome C peroxidase [Candidatus Lambdaproteobacteria bacterium RIFOXYD2_FULL_50_16]|uniref:Cytochrome C peroxidase n=1 Tax=Candidatus Lambdaproteobacteria bacterium RIFOXYD2_FULL_50_16 TaxID=1817772 RepID=A0A1F6G7L8_9PROT|nr:MAG: cytochrome C peroxidase [Candidatus Lambdaproteobacteria bacterium RIFOXYD2_FULL_50_16]